MQRRLTFGDSIVSGDLCAGNAFLPPVRTLVEETIPSVSGPPGKSADFQARADSFFIR
jgi:hypothetical protein